MFLDKFKYIVNSAKKDDSNHADHRTGFVDAIVKYGKEAKRYGGYMSATDLEYIRTHVNPMLMDVMKYPSIDPSKITS